MNKCLVKIQHQSIRILPGLLREWGEIGSSYSDEIHQVVIIILFIIFLLPIINTHIFINLGLIGISIAIAIDILCFFLIELLRGSSSMRIW